MNHFDPVNAHHIDLLTARLWLAECADQRPPHTMPLGDVFLTAFGPEGADLFDCAHVRYDLADGQVQGTMHGHRVVIGYGALPGRDPWWIGLLDADGDPCIDTYQPLVSTRGLDQAPPAVMRGQVVAWLYTIIGAPDHQPADSLAALTILARAEADARTLAHRGVAGWCRLTFGPAFERNAAWTVQYQAVAGANHLFNTQAVLTTTEGEAFTLWAERHPDSEVIRWVVRGPAPHGRMTAFDHGLLADDTVDPRVRFHDLLEALNRVRPTPVACPPPSVWA